MSDGDPIDLGLAVLDHQLVDADGRRCGKVDDLELAVGDERPCVEAILTGPPVWRGRGLLGRLAAALARGQTVRIAWEEVREVASAVHLRGKAEDLRLGRGDDRARRMVERLPHSR
jgi:hypothetical protein